MGVRGGQPAGMLFQHGALYSAFNVLENMALPSRTGHAAADWCRDAAIVKLQMVGLGWCRHAHAADLSGGMIKRVAGWRVRSSWIRRCCCWTSPPQA